MLQFAEFCKPPLIMPEIICLMLFLPVQPTRERFIDSNLMLVNVLFLLDTDMDFTLES